MTQQQVIAYINKKKDLSPVIQADVKLLTPNVQKFAVDNRVRGLRYLLKVPNFQPIDDVKWVLLKQDWEYSFNMKLNDQMKMYIAVEHPYQLQYFLPVSDQIKWAAIKAKPGRAKNLVPTQQMLQYAVNEDPGILKYMQDIPDNLAWIGLKSNNGFFRAQQIVEHAEIMNIQIPQEIREYILSKWPSCRARMHDATQQQLIQRLVAGASDAINVGKEKGFDVNQMVRKAHVIWRSEPWRANHD